MHRTGRPWLLGLPLVLFLASLPASEEALVPDPLEGYPSYAQEVLDLYETPGAAVCVVRGREVIYLEGFGYRDLQERLPVDPDTLFLLGGPSKGFTSLSMAVLVDAGLLEWDAPVVRYMPDFRLADDYRTFHATTRDLLAHTLAIGRYEDLLCTALSREDIVRRMRYMEPTLPFRHVAYTNLSYVAAGHLVDRLTGSTWEQFVQERILRPAGMTRTRFAAPGCETDGNFAWPHERFEGKIRRADFVSYPARAPAVGVVSTARDLCRWMVLHLNEGTIDGTTIVSKRRTHETHLPVAVHRALGPRALMPQAHGMGWIYRLYRGHQTIHHRGQTPGHASHLVLFPDHGLGIVALGNFINMKATDALAAELADRLLGLEPSGLLDRERDRLQRVAERGAARAASKEPEKRPATRSRGPSREVLEELAGDYEDLAHGVMEVRLLDGRLHINLHGTRGVLEHDSLNTWRITDLSVDSGHLNLYFMKSTVSFHLDPAGEVRGLTLYRWDWFEHYARFDRVMEEPPPTDTPGSG